MDALLNLHFVTGEEPIYRYHDFDWPVPIAAIAPVDGELVRELSAGPGHKVLYRGSGWSALISSWFDGGATTVEVTATTGRLADDALASIVSEAPSIPQVVGLIPVCLAQGQGTSDENVTRDQRAVMV